MALVDAPPTGVNAIEGDFPSFCTFWRIAERQTFYASAGQHFNCPIGAMVLGFELPADVQEQLGGFVEKMTQCSYIAEDEPPYIPCMSEAKAGAVYGPVADFPIDPQVVMMWLTPSKAMIFNEVVGSSQWSGGPQSMALGRPACSIIPTTTNESPFGMSLGCTGMRTFTEVSDEHLLVTLNYEATPSFLTRLNATLAANEEMAEFYDAHKSSISGS